jgi:hypothetical protein
MSIVRFGLGLGMAAVSALTMACGSPVAFVPMGCTVENGKLLSPAMDDASICRHFTETLNAELKATNHAALIASSAGDSIDISIRIMPYGEVIAVLSQVKAGEKIVHPELAVTVSDRKLAIGDLDVLAKNVADYVKSKS